MKEFRRFELHKFTAGILKIQASPPRFKRCLRGEKSVRDPDLNFTYGVETLILYQSLKIPNLSHYKMMVLNLQRITENDNMILLQNEDWFLS